MIVRLFVVFQCCRFHGKGKAFRYCAGVSAFRAMMNKHRDSNMPKLNVLLCETLVAVYVSWLCYSLALYDANVLYRLVGHSFHEAVWALLFGGCCKKEVVVSTPNPSEHQGLSTPM